MNNALPAPWPELPISGWRETYDTLHLWTQIVGKIRFARSPWLNHSWHVRALCHRARPDDLADPRRPGPSRSSSISLIMRLRISTATARSGSSRWPGNRSRFLCRGDGRARRARHSNRHRRDAERIAGADQVSRWTANMHPTIRMRYVASSRFSSTPTGCSSNSAPASSARPARCISSGAVSISRRRAFPAGRRRVIPAAYRTCRTRWPAKPIPTKYAAPDSGRERRDRLSRVLFLCLSGAGRFSRDSCAAPAAFFSEALGEFILPYDAVRTAADPDSALLEFLQSTYEAAANTAGWDRDALECSFGQPGVVRQI